jgi:hypothetical protein
MSGVTMDIKPVSVARRGVAATLDVLTVFFGAGYVIGALSGQLTESGFALTGGPALLLFAVCVAYFYIGRRVLGGTLWDRILGIGRPQPH